MRRSDWLVDMGPGAGVHGGEVDRGRPGGEGVAQQQVGDGAVPLGPAHDRRSRSGATRTAARSRCCGAAQHNLKNIDVEFPVGKFICVTGVSGSGKSTLVNEIVYKSLANRLNRARTKPGAARAASRASTSSTR